MTETAAETPKLELPTPDLFAVLEAPKDIEDLPEPKNGPYYVRDRIGYFVHRFTPFGRVLARLPKIPEGVGHDLGINGFIWRDFPKLPPELINQVYSFFVKVYDKQGTEAAVILLLDGKRQWSVYVPEQEVGAGSVNYEYDAKDIAPDQLVAGTIHSHCNFSAFHSHVDEGDADKHDGMHITIGDIKKEKVSVDVMFAFNQVVWNKKQFSLEDVTDATTLDNVEVPDAWIDKVKKLEFKPQNSSVWGDGWKTEVKKVDSNSHHNWGHYENGKWVPNKPPINGNESKHKNDQDDLDRYYGFYNSNPILPWPNDEDYASNPIRAYDEIRYDLAALKRIASDRGMTLTWSLKKPKGYKLHPELKHRGPAKPTTAKDHTPEAKGAKLLPLP